MRKAVRMVALFILFAGIGILTMGIYFAVVKAGIPYQDPTETLIAEYAAFDEAGKICIWTGSLSIVVGIAIMVLSLKKKKEVTSKKENQTQE
jgi:hypothetical protein